MPTPWWISTAQELTARVDAAADASLGHLWHLNQRVRFVHDNVTDSEVAADERGTPGCDAQWQRFRSTADRLERALREATAAEITRLRTSPRDEPTFRLKWESLGFVPHAAHEGTPADDYLDALYAISRLDVRPSEQQFANIDLSSRAGRVSDFLTVTEPTAEDVVFDLGSGSGKVALTVAGSANTRVKGVEVVPAHVQKAAATGKALGLDNLSFSEADVRDVDLSSGSIFYLYHPFRGPVASDVALILGQLAREKDICLYVAGPAWGFQEYFQREVDRGALHVRERRGSFDEVTVLDSERS